MADLAIAVAVSLYNKEGAIGETLASVSRQSLPPAEVVVVDDGSKDGSAREAERAGRGIPGFKLVRQPNSGVGVARNRGAAESRSPWIAYLDGDDIWLPDHLAELAALVKEFPDAPMAATAFREIGRRPGRANGARHRAIDYFLEIALGRFPFFTSTVLINRQIFDKVGGYPIGKTLGEDVALWGLLAMEGDIALSSRVTCLYRHSDVGLSHTLANYPNLAIEVFRGIARRAGDAGRAANVREAANRMSVALAAEALIVGRPDIAKAFLEEMMPTRMQARRKRLLEVLCSLPGPVATGLVRTAYRAKRALRKSVSGLFHWAAPRSHL